MLKKQLKMKQKNKKILSGTLGASLLENLLTVKDTIWAGRNF